MYGLEDPLDSPDFDPIAFINQNFPTGRVTHPTRTFSKSLIVSRLFDFFSNLTTCYFSLSFHSRYLSATFCTESSLDGLDTFVVGISSQISTLDEEISRAVQAQSMAGKQASKVIDAITEATDVALSAVYR